MYPAIEAHGIIGNLRTAALVSTDGTIVFACPLGFDCPALFASLLDDHKGGHCSIRPVASDYRRKQLYLPDTNVLITRFLAPDGVAEITDFMPLGSNPEESVIVRRITVTRGKVALRFECVPAFDYASKGHTAARTTDGIVFRGKGCGVLFIQSECRLTIKDGYAFSELQLIAGQHVTFVLSYVQDKSRNPAWAPSAGDALMDETIRFW